MTDHARSYRLVLLMLCVVWVTPAQSQQFVEKLMDPNGAPLDRFGSQVVLAGDWLFVASYPDTPVPDAGAVHVYKRQSNTWTLQQIITHDEPQMMGYFGLSMAADGDYLLLGSSFLDDEGSVDNGIVYVYRREGDTWTRQTKLPHPNSESQDHFGINVAIRGDVALIGARGEDDGALNTGTAYLYRRKGDTWTLETRLSPTANLRNYYFGTSVALSDGVAFVGAAFVTGDHAGTVYVFTEQKGDWVLTDTLQPVDQSDVRAFGRTLATDGTRRLIGDALNEHGGLPQAGRVYIYEQVNDIWTQQAILQAGDADAGDYFGDNLVVWDHFVAVGARTIKAGDFQGVVYLFEWQSDTDTWQEVSRLAAADHGTDNFGFRPSMDNGFLAIGAIGDREIADQAGAIFMYRLEGINPAPSSPQLLTPEDMFRLYLMGDPEQTISATWTEATDPDGEPVTYVWQFSLTRDFGEPILNVEAGIATELTITFGTLGSAMTDAGIFPVQTENVYHRVVASDGLSQTPSAVRVMRVTRNVLTDVEESELPIHFTLWKNYPNPFSPRTTIRYALTEGAFVRLAVYDLLGREVALLVDGRQAAGTDEVVFEAGELTSGLYLARIVSEQFIATRTLTLLK